MLADASREKVMVKVHKSDKLTQLALRLGLREVTDSLNFLGEGDTNSKCNVRGSPGQGHQRCTCWG